MSKSHFYSWCPYVQVVYGASRAAIYDFRSGDVYSLNHPAANIVRHVDEGTPIVELPYEHLLFLQELNNFNLIAKVDCIKDLSPECLSGNYHPLEFLWLELGGDCNLGCAHCYADSQNPKLFPQKVTATSVIRMMLRDWEGILKQAFELGCRQIQLTGGEVLLYRDLLRLIDFARELGFEFIEVYTNGMLLTEQRVMALATRDVHLAISLHGTRAETHDAVTGLRGSFEYTISGLNRVKEQSIPVRVAGVATQSNQHDIINLPTFAKSLGIADARFDIVREVGSVSDRSLIPDSSVVLNQKWLTTPTFYADFNEYQHNLYWNPCWAGKLAITSGGDVIPCIMGRSEVVGNLHEQTLAEVLANPYLISLRGLTKDEIDVCKDCEYRYVCGDCRPLALANGDLHGPVPRCTYDPYQGKWTKLDKSKNSPMSVIENLGPKIELVDKPSNARILDKSDSDDDQQDISDPKKSNSQESKKTDKKVIGDPDTNKSNRGIPPKRKRRHKNPQFECDPDR